MLFEALEQYHQMFVTVAEQVNIDYRALEVIAWMESRGMPDVVSASGAVGIMQVMPGEIIPGRPSAKDLLKPEINIRAGAEIFKHALDTFNGNYQLAIAAYYMGESWIEKYGIYYGGTLRYIDTFRAIWQVMFNCTYLPWEKVPRGFKEEH
jgi:soluble lytic murein transglycosylase-like protein